MNNSQTRIAHEIGYDGLTWVRLGEPEGRGWKCPAALRVTDRLPTWAELTVAAPVWELSRHSSGLYYRFRTDATRIAARWTLPAGLIDMPHMSALSVSGVDLYGEDEHHRLRFAGAGMPTEAGEQTHMLIEDIVPASGGLREYRLYLPTYNRSDDISVGVDSKARLELLPPDPMPPVVYYGSSIVQGAVASRPGMALPAVLGRRIGRPVINLGMSGSAKMEIGLADLITDVDAALYVIDSLPNMTVEQVTERAELFVSRLSERRPDVPVLLIEDCTQANAWLRTGAVEFHAAKRAELRKVYQRLIAQGDHKLYYLDGASMFGRDDDGTVDGKHPTDLGAHRMLRRVEPTVSSLLRRAEATDE